MYDERVEKHEGRAKMARARGGDTPLTHKHTVTDEGKEKKPYGDRSKVRLQLGLVILDVLSEREGELGGHDEESGLERKAGLVSDTFVK